MQRLGRMPVRACVCGVVRLCVCARYHLPPESMISLTTKSTTHNPTRKQPATTTTTTTTQQSEFPPAPGIYDLWDTDKPAQALRGLGYEEYTFRDRFLDIINSHDATAPLLLMCVALRRGAVKSPTVLKYCCCC